MHFALLRLCWLNLASLAVMLPAGAADGPAPPAPAPSAPPAAPVETLAADGAWCWFSDPRALVLDGKLLGGWMTADGSVQVGSLDLASGATHTATLAEKFERDDHDHPALLALPDGRVLAFYSLHASGDMRLRATTKPGDLREWTPERALQFENQGAGPKGVTYAHPVLLRGEHDALYVFWRGSDFKPTFAVSPDLGATWSAPRTLLKGAGRSVENRPYVKVWSDGGKRIDVVFTDGHPRNEPVNSVYFLRYENGAFHKADGTKIGTLADLPLDPAKCEKIYDGATRGRAWIWGVAEDAAGRPVVAYSRLPAENDHRYAYARWDGEKWQDHEITPAGKWFPQTPAGTREREPHYSAGLALDPADPATVYLARPVDGVFELERWTTPDGGATWQSAPVTTGSRADNVRPFVARAAAGPGVLLWMHNHGRYAHYTDYLSGIRFTRLPPSPPSAPPAATR